MIAQDTIIALATPQGTGAIGVIRLSGPEAIAATAAVFKGKDLRNQPSHTIHYGHIIDGPKQLDEVMVSVFRAPKSFTTEDVVEISCHGSPFIAEQIIRLFLRNGIRAARPGEFTLRAFMNGRIDLTQAEAVSDLIASNSQAALDVALKQMRGGFSTQIKNLRQRLVDFTSLIELELDFAEEDVSFASRDQLKALVQEILSLLHPLLQSFQLGNAIKHGVNTVIAGRPNAGKSTLLNALLNEQRAIVSDIPGTTRDTIEEVLHINGMQFRFIDTAGIRSTTDAIEKIGVEKAMEKLRLSSVYIYLFDVNATTPAELVAEIRALNLLGFRGIIAGNKIDKANWRITAPFHRVVEDLREAHPGFAAPLLFLSADTGFHIPPLKEQLFKLVAGSEGLQSEGSVVTNMRHYQAMTNAQSALGEVLGAIDSGMTGELVSLELKRSLEYLGEISGEVTNEEILGNIFSRFCIGK